MRKVFLALIGSVATAALVACGSGAVGLSAQGPGASLVSDAEAPSTVVDEELYTVTLPAGWTRTGEQPGQPAIVRYGHPDGRYLAVIVFDDSLPWGGDYSSDTTWLLDMNEKGDGFVIRSKEQRCVADDEYDPFCTAGDGALQVYALVKDEESVVGGSVGGHTFQFELGSTASEEVDESDFDAIITGLRIKDGAR